MLVSSKPGPAWRANGVTCNLHFMKTTPTLFIGDKNYSSWSLRPWLCLRWARIEFNEQLISLAQEGYGSGQIEDVLRVSPAGKVPALHVGTLRIWDSLAIAEWVAEQAPAMWPADAADRAEARSVVSEMHAGFPDLRDELPMNIQRRYEAHHLSAGALRNIDRVVSIWTGLRSRFAAHGPWLFGRRSIADAFYAPVATRFRTYGIDLPGAASAYSETLFADADFIVWETAPITDRFDFIDRVFTAQ